GPDVVAQKQPGGEGRQPAGNLLGVELFQKGAVGDVGGYDGGLVGPQTLVEQAVQGADEEVGGKLGAQSVQDQQVGPGRRPEQKLPLVVGVLAEAQSLQPAEKFGAGNVDHVESFFQGGPRNGQGGVGFAQARVAHQHQVFAVQV